MIFSGNNGGGGGGGGGGNRGGKKKGTSSTSSEPGAKRARKCGLCGVEGEQTVVDYEVSLRISY